MAKIAAVIFDALIGVLFVFLVGYKMLLLFRYRDDPAKRERLLWKNQVYPKWLARFIIPDDPDMLVVGDDTHKGAAKSSVAPPARKGNSPS